MASICLWINERDHDISRSLRGGQSFVEMCQTTWVHQKPTALRVSDGTVVSVEDINRLDSVY